MHDRINITDDLYIKNGNKAHSTDDTFGCENIAMCD